MLESHPALGIDDEGRHRHPVGRRSGGEARHEEVDHAALERREAVDLGAEALGGGVAPASDGSALLAWPGPDPAAGLAIDTGAPTRWVGESGASRSG